MSTEDLILQRIIENPVKAKEILETLATIILVELYEDYDEDSEKFILQLLEE